MDWSPALISLKTTMVATALALVAGVLFASWRANHRAGWLALADAVLLLPLVLPPTVVGLVLLTAFGRHSPVGQLLSTAGLPLVFTWTGTVATAFVVAFPLVYLMARSSFLMIDRELRDVASILGMSALERLVRLEIPLAWPGIAAGLVLGFARALGEFGATLMLAGNIPGRTQTLPVAVFFSAEAGNLAQALIYAGVLIAASLLLALAANRFAWRPAPVD